MDMPQYWRYVHQFEILLPLDLLCYSFLGTVGLCPWCLPRPMAPISLWRNPPLLLPVGHFAFLEPKVKHCGAWPLDFRKARWCLSVHRWIYLTHSLHMPMEHSLLSWLRFCSLSSVEQFLKFCLKANMSLFCYQQSNFYVGKGGTVLN